MPNGEVDDGCRDGADECCKDELTEGDAWKMLPKGVCRKLGHCLARIKLMNFRARVRQTLDLAD
ncbi:hypothetical protein SERLA73DRAFT_175598 [Serpula lacrymans var. lacrymans S7.3]|uniref:Uncharacterized protein n=2 Tax=Serpula lacrymans var. lacrymans TaxID=341189 RepID=F8PKV3_SERL3|nr:uncharacterized protein SERLADRAFT_445608 [Serpula lacrymans var. lacrymans S7.9]EGO03912.1 hypothetical protein SERLA73DRAFT_175598 [Serpula lacrymans var. lacrymans S7.3]EGO29834.1 hypothetical protein SERLADRAFT_445608 [Serpula lacrymans var. lacrymans S7.9]